MCVAANSFREDNIISTCIRSTARYDLGGYKATKTIKIHGVKDNVPRTLSTVLLELFCGVQIRKPENYYQVPLCAEWKKYV